MKYLKYLLIAFLIFAYIPLYAGDANPKGPLGKPITIDEAAGWKAPKEWKKEEAKRQWFESQMKNILNARNKDSLFQKGISNSSSMIQKQLELNRKNYTLFRELKNKADQIGQNISNYGENVVLYDDGSFMIFYDGQITDASERQIDDYGNEIITDTLGILYTPETQFTIDYNTTFTQPTEFKQLVYNAFTTDYIYYFDAIYNKDSLALEDTRILGTVENTSTQELPKFKTTDECVDYRDKQTNEVLPDVESELASGYTETIHEFNKKYYTETNATADAAGTITDEIKSYDYNLTSTDAPDVTETGSVSDINYFLIPKNYPKSPPKYVHHAQDPDRIIINYTQDIREASYTSMKTRSGITTTTYFYDAHYDSNNSLNNYSERTTISNQEIGRAHYSNITYDNYGRKISYNYSTTEYGYSSTGTVYGITYDSYSRISGYTENKDGTTYVYWGIQYNNLWQITDYYYSVNGVQFHVYNIRYNSHGLKTQDTVVSVSNGVTTTTVSDYKYNSNDLLIEITQYELRQGNGTNEFRFIYYGNITRNSIYAITGLDRVIIRDTNATTITNYSSLIPGILNAFQFDGTNFTLNPIEFTFDEYTTIYTEKFRNLSTSSQGNIIAVGTFTERATGVEGLRITDIDSDEGEVIDNPSTNDSPF